MRFLPALAKIIPIIGAHIEATIGWMPKIKPIVELFTPFSFASLGKKGARTDWMQEPSMPSPNIPIRVNSTIISC